MVSEATTNEAQVEGVRGEQIAFVGEIVGGTFVFGEPSAEPLLGVTVLESASIEVDSHNGTIHRLPLTRMHGDFWPRT